MIKFVLSIFIISSYLKFYTTQHNNRQVATTIEYSVAPIIDIIVKPVTNRVTSNFVTQNIAKIRNNQMQIRKINDEQISNGQAWSKQNKISSVSQNCNSRANQNQNNERQILNEHSGYKRNQNYNSGQIQNPRTGQIQYNGVNPTQIPIEQIWSNQNENTGLTARQIPDKETKQAPNSGINHSKNSKTDLELEEKNVRIIKNQNTAINRRQFPNTQTWHEPNQNSGLGQKQNSPLNQNQNTGNIAGHTFQKQNQNSDLNQSQNFRPCQNQHKRITTGQIPNQQTWCKQNQVAAIVQNQNSRPNQNTENTAEHTIYKQIQNFEINQSQTSRPGQDQNARKTAGHVFHNQNQNSRISQSQNSKPTQDQNAGNIAVQSSNRQAQHQNQNSETESSSNDSIVESYIVLGSQSISTQFSYNHQEYPNPYHMHQNQNTKTGDSRNNRIATGQINHNRDHSSEIDQNQNKDSSTRQVPNDNIEPVAILGRQSTSMLFPDNNQKYPNPYHPQQNPLNEQHDDKQGDNIVVTNNPYCTEIARALIEKGGNVREVFIATSLCEGFVHPMDSGIGGGFQAVYYNFENNSPKSIFIDSREKSPSSNKFTRSSTKIGGNSIAIPSVLAGYEAVYNIDKHNNRLQWSQIIQPVLNLCQNGFYMSKPTKAMMELIVESYNSTKVQINKFTIPKFCDTLIQISLDGPSSSMYRANGYLHKLLIQDLRSVKSTITSSDIENYRVEINQPAVTRFEKYTVYSTKAPGSGQAILFALKIIERLRKVIPSKATADEKIIYLLKILKYTYTLKPHLREISENEINKIINEASQSLAEGIVKAGFKLQNTIPTKFGDITLPKLQTSPSRGTTNIVIKIGKSAITASSSIGSLFGSGIFSETMGFCYNSHLRDFSNPNWRRNGKPLKNVAGPNKVTSSTIAPVIMVDDSTGEPVFQIGSAGGSHILSAIVNTCFNYFILNRSLNESVAACRIMPKLNYSRNEVIYSYECINNERSFFNSNTAKRLRRIGVVFKYGKPAGNAAVTSLSKLRNGYPEAVFDNRRGGSSFIE